MFFSIKQNEMKWKKMKEVYMEYIYGIYTYIY